MAGNLKIRARKDGSAVPLSEADKQLLNAMQGRFPLEPRPYARVAAEAGMTEDAAIARVAELIGDRIIRQVTPIYDTRAFGYGSMLVAAKVDAEHPWGPAKIVNSHPGVSHNYLRNHEFNMWFTIAVEEAPHPREDLVLRDLRLRRDGRERARLQRERALHEIEDPAIQVVERDGGAVLARPDLACHRSHSATSFAK